MVSINSKAVTFTNGTANDASQVDSEMSNLFTNDATLNTEVIAIGTGTYTFTGPKTFSSTPKMDAIAEKTAATGVTVDGVVLKDSGVALPAAGELTIATGAITITGTYHRVDTEADAATDDLDTISGGSDGKIIVLRTAADARDVVIKHGTGNISLADDLDFTLANTGYSITLEYDSTDSLWYEVSRAPVSSTAYPTKYMNGAPPTYTSATTVTIPSGFKCRDATDAYNITFSSNQAVAITTSGANGLDTGAEANSTWYYLWAIGDTSGSNSPAGLLSVSSSAPTVPAGYDVKRLLPIAIRNDGSGNFISFFVGEGWPQRPSVYYVVDFGEVDGTAGPTNVLDNGTATTDTTVSLASFVPPISTRAILYSGLSHTSAKRTMYIGKNGGSDDEIALQANADQANNVNTTNTDANQAIQYRISSTGAAADIAVKGFVVTEVN